MKKDTICGGRHKTVLNKWEKVLTELKKTGCKLVFHVDFNLQEEKVNTWLDWHNGYSENYEEIYQKITDGKSLEMIANEVEYIPPPTFYGTVTIAKKYGEFHYAVKYESDRELAMYANNQKAMAIMSNDTDFCIFNGSWKLWTCREIDISEPNKVTTIEYNRKGFAKMFNLSSYQLPLLATLAGNGIISDEQLQGFHKEIKGERFSGLTKKIKPFHCNPLSESDIARISKSVFGKDDNNETRLLIRQSIESYNINGKRPTVDEMQLSQFDMNKSLVSTQSTIQRFLMAFYDFGCDISFPNLLTEWLKRRMGLGSVLLLNESGDSTLTIFTKKEQAQPYKEYKETKIYHDCQ